MRLLTLICLVLLSSCSQQPEVVTGHILVRDGITYHQDTNEPITGIVEEFYENGQLWFKGKFVDGKREDGIKEHFHENGNLSRRTTYRDGKPNGPTEMFYPNGEFMKKGNFVDGKIENPEEWYNK